MTIKLNTTGVNTIFTHDTEVALASAAALINTLDGAKDGLSDVRALDEFIDAWKWSGYRAHDEHELKAVRDLRPTLRRLWEADEDQVVAMVNELLRKAKALPQLVRHDEWPYHMHATSPDAPLATRMAVEAAMAFIDLIRNNGLTRLRICAFPGCANVVIDLSRNGSKRFCESGCGNRAAVAAYRARKAGKRV